ncbi:alpha/beta hydrolase [Cellulomonas aerilata]|uniref:Esterase n=1 Tax=Cellulomonas aerilata TaxID=515326 RepID=A0A512DDN5_9CELL|nr:alpha/beta hydrolase-fold protein [Cellulomonas aerilata]GEO34588.1 esterase [Cellulomonas aerilata]
MARTRPRPAGPVEGAAAVTGTTPAAPAREAGTDTARAARAGTVLTAQAPSSAVGSIDHAVYLPPGYDDEPDRAYASLYLLHGRGDTQAAWQRVTGDLDRLIVTGAVQPMVVVMPDAPWNQRASWYTDSRYTGRRAGDEPGVAVETAFTRDLVDHVDATYRTVGHRGARAVGGYSMGGAGALRFALAHQDRFSAALVLSAAVYVPQPPSDSSTRDHGAYGDGPRRFVPQRFTELSHPAAMAAFDPALPVHLFIAVGDDEDADRDPRDAEHALDRESARLHDAARRVEGITAELRVLPGGHDWDVWQPAFREGVVDIAAHLHTSQPDP